MLFIQWARIASLASRGRLPTVTGSREMAAAGFLPTYGQNQSREFRRVATYVDRILKGARPADLPVEQPTSFDLVINCEDREGAGRDDPGGHAGARGPDHRVIDPAATGASGDWLRRIDQWIACANSSVEEGATPNEPQPPSGGSACCSSSIRRRMASRFEGKARFTS
jgi:hypothetical protein